MTREEKQLLIKDICARVPYEIIIRTTYTNGGKEYNEDWDGKYFRSDEVSLVEYLEFYDNWNPYLRPMSSMTPDERFEYDELRHFYTHGLDFNVDEVDWLNAHHFDYRGLIEKGLALEAPDGMYK